MSDGGYKRICLWVSLNKISVHGNCQGTSRSLPIEKPTRNRGQIVRAKAGGEQRRIGRNRRGRQATIDGQKSNLHFGELQRGTDGNSTVSREKNNTTCHVSFSPTLIWSSPPCPEATLSYLMHEQSGRWWVGLRRDQKYVSFKWHWLTHNCSNLSPSVSNTKWIILCCAKNTIQQCFQWIPSHVCPQFLIDASKQQR